MSARKNSILLAHFSRTILVRRRATILDSAEETGDEAVVLSFWTDIIGSAK